MLYLINAAQLDKFRKSQKNVTILDATWFLPTENKDAKNEFFTSHIAGARFLDLSDFNDRAASLPNMLERDEKIISEKVSALGITNEHKIIFYDNSPLHTSCRAFWMFKTFGHPLHQLFILDGGFDAWQKYGGKIETGEPRPINKKNYSVNFQAHLIRTLVQMKTNLHHPKEQVVDARHPVRYAGEQETRVGLRAGHIPGSSCFPYFSLFETTGRFKPIEKIRRQFMGVGIDMDSPIVTTCGSGMSCAALNFAFDLIGQTQHALYDGSWSEWGADKLYSGETSLAERPVITSLDKQS